MSERCGPFQDQDLEAGGDYSFEVNCDVLSRRQKQIEYGYNTLDYSQYKNTVPLSQRCPSDPRTPNVQRKYSRNIWDGLIKDWKVGIHDWARRNPVNSDIHDNTSTNTESISFISDNVCQLPKQRSCACIYEEFGDLEKCRDLHFYEYFNPCTCPHPDGNKFSWIVDVELREKCRKCPINNILHNLISEMSIS